MDATGRDFLPFSDLDQSVREDVETLCKSKLTPKDSTISCVIYEVQIRELREVVRS